MKIRSRSMLTGIALAALLAASIPSGLRAQQPPPSAPSMPGAPDFGSKALQIESGAGNPSELSGDTKGSRDHCGGRHRDAPHFSGARNGAPYRRRDRAGKAMR